MTRVMLLIGTRKGAFLAFSDADRRRWELQGPIFKGVQVNDVVYTAEDGGAGSIIVAGKSEWWGPGVQVSTDLGESWEERPPVRFAEGRGLSVERVWIVRRGRLGQGAPALFAGVGPAALFASTDDGASWREIEGLTNHDSRPIWSPGAGGLMVHSICDDPDNPMRMYAGISIAGVFRTDDGGATWQPKNTNVRADFSPNKFPEVGVCVHHLEMHPSNPQVLYQQNHCGVYRTDNAGDEWIDISDGLPSRFGFPLAVHPHDGDTIYVCPAESDQHRSLPESAFRVYRSRDRGETWETLTSGLPQRDAHTLVLRQALATDTLDQVGLYMGTSGGHLLASRNEGDDWEVLFNWLPPIASVQAAVIDG